MNIDTKTLIETKTTQIGAFALALEQLFETGKARDFDHAKYAEVLFMIAGLTDEIKTGMFSFLVDMRSRGLEPWLDNED